MLLQAAALALLAVSDGDLTIAGGTAALLGLGTALVYPMLIAGGVADVLGCGGANRSRRPSERGLRIVRTRRHAQPTRPAEPVAARGEIAY